MAVHVFAHLSRFSAVHTPLPRLCRVTEQDEMLLSISSNAECIAGGVLRIPPGQKCSHAVTGSTAVLTPFTRHEVTERDEIHTVDLKLSGNVQSVVCSMQRSQGRQHDTRGTVQLPVVVSEWGRRRKKGAEAGTMVELLNRVERLGLELTHNEKEPVPEGDIHTMLYYDLSGQKASAMFQVKVIPPIVSISWERPRILANLDHFPLVVWLYQKVICGGKKDRPKHSATHSHLRKTNQEECPAIHQVQLYKYLQQHEHNWCK
ncbi:hypothetical protein C8R45DRAFT_947593 [Mycena sanguinolenta]|nr:hypothetical protein C8R45DRAFT_947593 [Mycena sanguinolenta]